MKYGIALMLALTLNAVANLMMKIGVGRLKTDVAGGTAPLLALLTNWVLIVGLVFFASNVVLYTFALAGIKISIAYPVMVGGGFVIISIVAWQYLGERLTTMQWAGVACILLGVWLVARELGAPAGSAARPVAAVSAGADAHAS